MKNKISVGAALLRKTVIFIFVVFLLFGFCLPSASAATTTIYVNGSTGDDAKTGLSVSTAVATLPKAYSLLGSSGGKIYIVDTVSVSSSITITGTTAKPVTIARYSSCLDYMIDITSTGSLTLKNVTVDGENVDANYSVFRIAEGGTLTANGGTWQNCRAVSRVGGVVYNNGNVNLANLLVTNNYSQYDGAGIFSFKTGVITSSGCTFSNNSVQEGTNGLDYCGAAVYSRGTYTSTNDKFLDNHADFGGAIYSEGKVSITGGVFTGNTSTSCGGALVLNTTGTGTITNSTFTNNQSKAGGAIQNQGELVLKDCTLTSNSASSTGGAIYNTDGTTSVGILYIRGDTLISKNTANDGGAIWNYEGTVYFEGGSITENQAIPDEGDNDDICFGGGVYCVGSSDRLGIFNMSGGTISNNYAYTNGGGIYVNYDSEMNMSGGTITENTCVDHAGGVYLMERTTFNFTGGTISDNTAAQGGGIYNLSTMNMSGGTISGNVAESSTHTTSGGGIYICEDATLNMSGGLITGNSADFGDGIRVAGFLNFSAGAKVATDDDVYLNTDCIINLDGKLSYSDTAAVVTPNSYRLGRECVRVSYGTDVASDVYTQFDLTPKNNYLFRPGDCYDDSVGISDTAVVISETYGITYDANGGTGAPAAQTKYWNEPLTLTSGKPTRTGYTFKSWNTKSDGSGTTYSSGAAYSENKALTLYAQWDAASYTNRIFHWASGFVNSEGNNSNKTMFNLGETRFTASYGSTYVLDTDRAVSIPNGYNISTKFGTSAISGSWANYDMGTSVTQKNSFMNYEYDYHPINYSITYNLDGGINSSSNPETYNVLYGVTFEPPTKEGYKFIGWKDSSGKIITGINEGCNATFADVDDMYEQLETRSTGNRTFTANWEPITYSVKYNVNGGSGSMSDSAHTYDVEKALTKNTFVKDGYKFIGWATSSDGEVVYEDQELVLNLTSENDDVVNLYAQWVLVKVGGYVDGVNGNDNNSGGTPSDPIKTLRQAYINLQKTGGTIYIVDTVTVNSSMNLTKTSYSDSIGTVNLDSGHEVAIKRYSKPTTVNTGFDVASNLNALIKVADSGNLVLSNITIDGHKDAYASNNVDEIAEGVEAHESMIVNNGELTLDGAIVTSNAYTTFDKFSDPTRLSEEIFGGGIYNTGSLSIINGSIITDNEVLDHDPDNIGEDCFGAGIYNAGTMELKDGFIENNQCDPENSGVYCYGGGVYNVGTITMTGGEVRNNVAGFAGGIYNLGTVNMSGGKISKNTAGSGAGIMTGSYDTDSVFNMSGTAEVSENTAKQQGGGVYVDFGTFNMSSGKVTNNIAKYGAGVYVSGQGKDSGKGVFHMTGGEITHNKVNYDGSGIYAYNANVLIEDGKVSYNGGINSTDSVDGAGVYMNQDTLFTMTGGEVSHNDANTDAGGEGGGFYLDVYGVPPTLVIKGDALVAENAAMYGGGVMNMDGILFLEENGVISNNTAILGGGVYNRALMPKDPDGYGTFTMSGGTITQNTAVAGSGVYNGGYYSDDTTGGYMVMTGGKITDNIPMDDPYAVDDGVYNWLGIIEMSGGVIEKAKIGLYNDNGTVIMSDAAEISGCDKYGVFQDGSFQVKDAPVVEQPVFLTPDHFITVVGPCTSYFIAAMDDEDTFEGRVVANYTFDSSGQKDFYSLDGTTKGYADAKGIGVGDKALSSGEYPYCILLVEMPKEYIVHYNGNTADGGSMEPDGFVVGVEKSLQENGFTKTGYQFTGWNTAANGTGTGYQDKQIVKDLCVNDSNEITLYAQWNPVEYTVRYHANGGSGVMADSLHTYDVEKVLAKNSFTRTGYSFAGWALSSSGETKYADQETVKNLTSVNGATVNLYAKWDIIEYNITYVPNGGTMPDDVDTKYTVEDPVTLPEPTRPGYEFEGWHEEEDFSDDPVTDTEGEAGDKVYYAEWKLIDYSITYNLNGGSLASGKSNPISYNIESATFTLNNPTKTGYTFAGWTGSNGTTPQTAVTIEKGSTGAKTYTANWTPNTYTVKYHSDGGSGIMADSLHTYDVEKALTKNSFTRTGYTFAGWALSSSGETKYADQETVKNLTSVNGATVNLYAKWDIIEYNITYVPNGGTMPDDVDTKYTAEDPVTLPEPTRPGYEFEGWHEEEDFSDDPVTDTEGETGDKVYYAEWKLIDYSITYNLNGGSLAAGKSNPTSYNIESATFTLNNPTKAGYTFAGWTGSNGTVPETSVSVEKGSTGARTYTANWEENILTINYYSNYADKAFADALNIVSSSSNVLVRTETFNYSDKNIELRKYSSSSDDTYLGRTHYSPTGYWVIGSGNNVHEDATFNSAQELAEAFGTSIEASSATIQVYPQWTRNIGGYVADSGNDATNSGATPDDPVATFRQAYQNLQNSGGTIYVVDTVTISSDITLGSNYYEDSKGRIDLADGKSVVIKRYSKPTVVNEGFNVNSNVNTLVLLEAGTLVLDHVVIDGHRNPVTNSANENYNAPGVVASASSIDVRKGAQLNVNGAFLQNHYASYSGAVIYNQGTVILNEASISNNYSHYFGGALYNSSSGIIRTSGSNFTNNAVREGSDGITYEGGAIYNNGSLTSENDVFSNNSADIGGAIHNKASLNVSGGTFDGNNAIEVGGAICNDTNGTATLTNSVLKENHASSGGCLQNIGEITIIDCELVDNSVVTSGGAINNGVGTGSKGIVTIKGNTLISRNTAGLDGGGISNLRGTINLEGGTISYNTVNSDSYSGFGGGVYNEGYSGSEAVFNMSGGFISHNSAKTNGAGVYNNRYTVMNLSDGTISYNEIDVASDSGDHNGGGIYIYDFSTLNMTGGLVQYNSAASGAGVYNLNVMNMSGGTISNNKADSPTHTSYGGGIYIGSGDTLNLSSGTINGNSADIGDGVYQNGTFNMNSYGKVHTDNDVYLPKGHVITINGKLLYSDIGAIITPGMYELGRVCVRTDYSIDGVSAVASDVYEQFKLTPKDPYLLRPGDFLTEDANTLDTDVVISEAYSIQYNANGGAGAPDSQIKYWYEPLTLSAIIPSRENYEFSNWNTSINGSGNAYSPSEIYNENISVTLYAQWNLQSFAITYVLNGGTNHPLNPDHYTIGEGVEKFYEPTKDNCDFLGWYEDPGFTKQIVTIEEDRTGPVTIYAKWTVDFVIHHYQMDTNGSYPTDPSQTETKTGVTGENLLLSDLSKSFVGFTYSHGEVDGETVESTVLSGDTSLIISLYYSRNKHSVFVDAGVGIDGVSGGGTYYFGESVTISALVSSGYDWSEWTGTIPSLLQIFTFVMPDSDVINTALGSIATPYSPHVISESGVIRFIKGKYLGTLDSNSKWMFGELNRYLNEILSDDLSGDSTMVQEWHVSAEDFEYIHDWCQAHPKGTETNKVFLDEFNSVYNKNYRVD